MSTQQPPTGAQQPAAGTQPGTATTNPTTSSSTGGTGGTGGTGTAAPTPTPTPTPTTAATTPTAAVTTPAATSGGSSTAGTGAVAGGSGCFPCELAGVNFALSTVSPPSVFVTDRVLGAGVLMLAYQYGTRLRFFDAPTRARELLDTDRICVDDRGLLDRLYCWPERDERLDTVQRARLMARVLGVPHPDVDDAERDTLIQPLLARLLDAINAVCDPGPFRKSVPPASEENLDSALLAVRARLSQSMTGLVTQQVRDLQRQLDNAIEIVTDLATDLQLPCGFSNSPAIWGALDVLVGDQLRSDGVDIIEGAQTAEAWSAIFAFLDGSSSYVKGTLPSGLCGSVALLRPPPCQPKPELLR